jgi:hypothetical protein
MRDADQQELGLLAKVVLALAVVLIAAGVFWHGVAYSELERFWRDLADRPTGAMKFRFFLQPLMATVVAVRDARSDARTGRSPYFMTMLLAPNERIEGLREALNATARIILIALVIDVIYQVLVLKMFYPVEALVTALLLAFVPYVAERGFALRIIRRFTRSSGSGARENAAARRHEI